MSTRRVISTSELVLPAHGTIRRLAPRPAVDQDPDYQELFDSQTVFCDVFRSGNRIIMPGPPLMNLRETFLKAEYLFDGEEIDTVPVIKDLDRVSRTEFTTSHEADEIVIKYGDYSTSMQVRADLNSIFENQNVLLAMQRNNPLHWIREWAEFYVKINKVQGIILYDLMSSEYTAEAIVEALDDVPGLESLVVVKWPYKYGAQPTKAGQAWDSDFGQYVAWEHCKFRFLQKCRAITVADLDELFLAEDGRSIFDHAEEADSGSVRFQQRFIESIVDEHPSTGKDVSYSNYFYYDGSQINRTPKYAAMMSTLSDENQLLVHAIAHRSDRPTDQIVGRQFLPMKLAWQRRSFDRKYPDKLGSSDATSKFVVDENLRMAYNSVWPNS